MKNILKKLATKKVLIPGAIVLIVGGGIAFAQSRNGESDTATQERVAGVKVETVNAKSEIKVPVKLTGQIKGKQSTDIRALVDGTLQSLTPVSTKVSRGTPLFRLSNQSVDAAYQAALSSFNNAQITSTETDASANNALSSAQLSVDQARANLELAEQALRDGQTTAALNLKIAQDNAQIAYLQGYNTLEDVMRYLGESSLTRYRFEKILSGDQTAKFEAENQFIFAKNAFLSLEQTTSSNLEQDLRFLKAGFEEVNDLNDKSVTLLNFAVEGNNFTSADLSAAKTQAAAFRSSLNLLQTTIANNRNTLQNTKTQNQISTESLKKGLEIAEIKLRNTETALSSQKNASAIQKIGASSSVSSAQAQLASARRNFSNLQVPAPFSGTVISHEAAIGSQVSPGQVILEIGDLNIIEIKINLASSMSKGLVLGQSVKIDGHEIGRISEIEPAADQVSGKIGVTIEADNSNNQFVPGSIADVEFELEFQADNVIVIPLKLVKITQDSQSVLVIRDSKIVEQPVELGDLVGDQVQVTQGLAAGDRIVVENGGFLSEGDRVKIEN